MRLSGTPALAAERPIVLIIPKVTVLSRPTGLPTAIAQSPTCMEEELPRTATGNFSPWGLIFTTAKSVISSVPRTSPLKLRPSFKVTVTLSALSTTWALVKIKPLPSIIKPDPWPATPEKKDHQKRGYWDE